MGWRKKWCTKLEWGRGRLNEEAMGHKAKLALSGLQLLFSCFRNVPHSLNPFRLWIWKYPPVRQSRVWASRDPLPLVSPCFLSRKRSVLLAKTFFFFFVRQLPKLIKQTLRRSDIHTWWKKASPARVRRSAPNSHLLSGRSEGWAVRINSVGTNLYWAGVIFKRVNWLICDIKAKNLCDFSAIRHRHKFERCAGVMVSKHVYKSCATLARGRGGNNEDRNINIITPQVWGHFFSDQSAGWNMKSISQIFFFSSSSSFAFVGWGFCYLHQESVLTPVAN